MNKEVLKVADLKDMLNKTGELYGDRPGYTIKTGDGERKTYTHKEIRDMINYLGTALIDLGTKELQLSERTDMNGSLHICLLFVVLEL